MRKKRELTIELLVFAITVIVAVVMKWDAGDLVWGFWTCNLCFGFAVVCIGIAASVLHAEDFSQIYLILLSPFILAFFTLFLVLGHWILSFFINGFFPLVEDKKNARDFSLMLSMALEAYWPLVLLTFVSRFSELPFSGVDFSRGVRPMLKPILNIYRVFLLIIVLFAMVAIQLAEVVIFPVLLMFFFPWNTLLGVWREKDQ